MQLASCLLLRLCYRKDLWPNYDTTLLVLVLITDWFRMDEEHSPGISIISQKVLINKKC